MILRLQKEGRVDPEIDAQIVALALSAMVGRMAFVVYVLGEKIPFEKLVSSLNRVWTNAIKLDQGGTERAEVRSQI